MLELIVMLVCILGVLGLSWAITAGFVWLICLCFGWTFSLLIATGCWLIMLILASIFKN